MVKRYVVYAANCICDAPPNSDGQYVLVADYDALAARLAEAEETYRSEIRGLHETSNTLHRDRDRLQARLAEAERLLRATVALYPFGSTMDGGMFIVGSLTSEIIAYFAKVDDPIPADSAEAITNTAKGG